MATTLGAVKNIVESYGITDLSRRGIKVTNKSGHLVSELRDKFLASVEPGDCYYKEDIEKVRRDDWFVKRFLLARNRDVSASLSMMKEALKWRKSEGIRDLQPDYFPEDLFRLSSMFIYAPDREGNVTIYFRPKLVIKHTDMVCTLKKFGNYLLNIVDEETNGAGITVIADFNGAGVQVAESVDLLFYSISTINSYFPFGISHIVIIDLPFFLRACWYAAKPLVPSNRRKLVDFISTSDITKLVAIENLPDFLGGTCKLPYKGHSVVPPGCPSTYDFARNVLGLSDRAAEKLENCYKPIADEIEAADESTAKNKLIKE